VSLKILLENLLRREDGKTVRAEDIEALRTWLDRRHSVHEIAFLPARVLMQDFTGVPAVVDLAAMRDAVRRMGGDPRKINPILPVDLVIDHSVTVDAFGSPDAFRTNVAKEFARNRERYRFLRWGQRAFDNFRVVPPGTGICHQVNLEYFATVVCSAASAREPLAYPDTVLGTDSHTTMVNGLGVLGWGVGGIEAEAAMLGQPISMVIPDVVGFRLTGALREGTTATDLVLTVTELLRRRGVVGKFVEFFGPALEHLTLPDRATIANMAPEYGATCGFFPVDGETLRYLRFTGRPPEHIALVEAYAKEQGLWHSADAPAAAYTELVELDLSTVEPSLAGPRRPQDRLPLSGVARHFDAMLPDLCGLRAGGSVAAHTATRDFPDGEAPVPGKDFGLRHGHVVIAAITSCTNTSNPSVMIAAGLVARNAVERGLRTRPWVKTSLAPGSQVVTDYLRAAGLQPYLEELGFHLVGYGCTTCIGNSGPLDEAIARAIEEHGLVAAAVLSGNRNFEGRIHPQVRANYLASPPLVVAYALAGSVRLDVARDPLGTGADGKPVYLRDIWPSEHEIRAAVDSVLTPEMFANRYADVFRGEEQWQALEAPSGLTFEWDETSTYIRRPPYFDDVPETPPPTDDIEGARALVVLGDSVTTDHISPAGSIKTGSPAGAYLLAHGVQPPDFNSYGSRRGNHEVMVRGTFANIRLRNEMVPDRTGGFTKHMPEGTILPIYDAAMQYCREGVPLVIVAGKEYGTGSSRDWAAKGTRLLGVRAVIAESFERIHRSNLIGMGVLPLQFPDGVDRRTLGIDGTELFWITGLRGGLRPGIEVHLTVRRADGTERSVPLRCRIDTAEEAIYYAHGGILPYVLRQLR